MQEQTVLEFIVSIIDSKNGNNGKLTLDEIEDKTIEIYKTTPVVVIKKLVNKITKELNEGEFDVYEKEEILAIKQGLNKILNQRRSIL